MTGIEMVQLVCILHGGPERILVDGKGKKWHFEDHPYCGPVVVGNNGDPLENQPLAHANTAQNALIKIAAKANKPGRTRCGFLKTGFMPMTAKGETKWI